MRDYFLISTFLCMPIIRNTLERSVKVIEKTRKLSAFKNNGIVTTVTRSSYYEENWIEMYKTAVIF